MLFINIVLILFFSQNISALAKVNVKVNNITGHVDTVKYVGFDVALFLTAFYINCTK